MKKEVVIIPGKKKYGFFVKEDGSVVDCDGFPVSMDSKSRRVILSSPVVGAGDVPDTVGRKKYSSDLPQKYRRYILSANKRKLSFKLSVDQFNLICDHPCVYCGYEGEVGIDRKDSSIGYEAENCLPCCGKCNMMKHRYSMKDFLSHVKKIYSHSLGESK